MGKTVPEIRTELEGIVPIEKLSFGCCGVETFNQKLDRLGRKQVILAGIETHVCVLQTADDHAERLRYPCGGRCNLFKEEIRLGDRSEMDGKKRGDDLDHRDHRLSTVEGGWDGGVQEVVKIAKIINPPTAEPLKL